MKKLGVFILTFALSLMAFSVTAKAAVQFGSTSATLMAGTTETVYITAQNISSNTNVIFSITPKSGDCSGYLLMENKRMTLTANETAVIAVQISAVDATKAGSATFIVTAYSDNNGQQGAELGSGTVSVTVTAPASQSTATPTPAPTSAPVMKADIAVVAPTSYLTTVPGKTITVTVTFENKSKDYVAKNFVPSPGILVDFKLEFGKRQPGLMQPGGRESFTFIITPTEDAAPKTYSVPFTYVYEDRNGNQFSGEDSITVKVEAPPKLPTNVILGNFQSNPVNVSQGQHFSVSADLKNIAEGGAEEVSVTVSGFDGKSVSLIGSDTLYVGSLASGEDRLVSFDFRTADKLAVGSYPVKFTVKYKTASGDSASYDSTYYVIVTSGSDETDKAVLEITEITRPSGSFDVGDEAVIKVVVTNNGDGTAKNIRITGAVAAGFVPTSSNIHLINSLKPGESVELAFSFTPTTDSKTQTYLAGFTVEYESGELKDDGTLKTESFTQYTAINVSRKEKEDTDRAIIEVVNVAGPQNAVKIAETTTVSITVVNNGNETAKNVKISATCPTNIVPASSSIQLIAALEPGESKTITFSFMPTSESKTQTYMVGFSIDYEIGAAKTDGSKATDSFMQYAGISVNNPESTSSGSKSVPKIILSEYLITSTNVENPRVVLAGREFDLFVKVKNTHPEKTVKNIIVSMSVPETSTSAGNVFTPVGGSNSFYIGEIKPGEEFEHTIRMYCLNNAVGKNYVIKVMFTYEDEEGNPLTAPEEIGVTVRQADRMEFGTIIFPSPIGVGEMAFFNSISIRNTGYVTLKNLKLYIESDGFNCTGSEYIVGNLSSGNYDYYDGSITALTTPGEYTVKLIAAYDLDTGEHVVIENVGIITIVEGGGSGGEYGSGGGMDYYVSGPGGGVMVVGGASPTRPGGAGNDLMADGEGGSSSFIDKVKDIATNFWVWIGVGAVAAIVVTIIVVKKIKKRRNADIDLDL